MEECMHCGEFTVEFEHDENGEMVNIICSNCDHRYD